MYYQEQFIEIMAARPTQRKEKQILKKTKARDVHATREDKNIFHDERKKMKHNLFVH